MSTTTSAKTDSLLMGLDHAQLDAVVGGDNPGMGPYTPPFLWFQRESENVEDWRHDGACYRFEYEDDDGE